MSTNITVTECPTWVPAPTELSDLELLLDGAYPLLTGFLGAADVDSVRSAGRLADGRAWPVPITLQVPDNLVDAASVELRDPEGAPIAIIDNVEPFSDATGSYLGGPVRLASSEIGGALRRIRPPAPTVRASLPDDPVLAVLPQRPLHRRQLAQINHAAAELEARVLVLPRMTGPRPEALVQAILAAKPELPDNATIVPLPLHCRDDAERDVLLQAHVAAAYGATHLLGHATPEHSPLPVIETPEMVRDSQDRWLPAASLSNGGHDLGDEELEQLLDAGSELPAWFTTPAIAEQQARLHPPRHECGFTVLFTGLSGAGKSTIAKRLRDELAQHDKRSVTLLDGDVVRRQLCAGLGFSAEDRSRNVQRIGWVAAEINKHGGAAICAPIAPYAEDRAAVREMVTEVGEFILVYIATPLTECERRDRKGLYSKAREGSLPEFTGVSAPYEAPGDADLVLDTSLLTPEETVGRVVDLLRERDLVRPWTSG